MESNFLNSLVKYFMEKNNYHLIKAEDMPLDLSSGIATMIKEFQGTSILLEIVDGEKYGTEQIRSIMSNGANVLNNINGSNAYIFKLFLFDGIPDSEKEAVIEQGQMDITSEKRFLKCISVNIPQKQAKKHFSVPAYDAGIVKLMDKFFAKGLDKRETVSADIEDIINRRNKDMQIQIKAKKPWLTYIIIAISIIMWGMLELISMRTGTSYAELLGTFGAKINNLIMEGQYWRFIAPMFLHAGLVHLTLNCYSLYVVGSQVESIFGRGKFAAIYFISGLIASIMSFAFSLNSSVGASGAIFGLMGAMLYFAVRRPTLLKGSFGANLITILVINLAYGYMNKQIDNNAHIGGLIGGFLTTGVVYAAQDRNSRERIIKVGSFILAAAVTIGGLLYGFNNNINKFLPKVSELEKYNSQSNWAQLETNAEEILGLNPSDKNVNIQVLWFISKAEINQGKYKEGIPHAEKLTQLSPADGHYLLGVIYYNTNELEKAEQELQQARELGSPNKDIIDQMLTNIQKSK
jgi:rhomboid protease GluP